MLSRNRHVECPVENWSSFSCVDSFESLGHAVVESMTDKISGPLIFVAKVAIKGLKVAISEVKN